MKMRRARVPDRLLTDEQKAYQKELRRRQKELVTMHAISKNPMLASPTTKDMLRQALFQYSELLKNPPQRKIEELAQQPSEES